MMHGFGMMPGFGWPGMIMMALFWIGVVVLVIWGVSNLFPTRRPATETDAIAIVRQRFARGEISREEYEQAVATLRMT